MATEGLPEHVQALLSRDAYDHDIQGDVRLIQTHVSFVLLAGDHVYKIKKPVNFGFIDYSTREKRKRACEAEVRLNKRGCPEIYLDVAPIVDTHRAIRVGGRGNVLDYGVHMKRLPEGRMMDELLQQDAITLPMLGQLAGRLAQFHGDASRSERITRIGGASSFGTNWRHNIDNAGRYTRRTITSAQLTHLHHFSDAFLHEETALLRKRDRDGWIRDCHGDLRSDAVCFDESLSGGIGLVDCIEFNDALRYTDTGLDVAFLAMDLEFRGRPDLADVFVGLYCAAMSDKELPLLLNAYRCYRASVRGVVESLMLDDNDVRLEQKAGAEERAKRYFKLAESYSKRQKKAEIVLTMGLSGSGKSVLAGALASRLSAVYLATDVVRRQIEDDSDGDDKQRYAQEQRDRVYEVMALQAETYIEEGRSVVLDGTYIEARQRAAVVDTGKRLGVPLMVVECAAPEDVVKQRQEQREHEVWTASEGRWDVYLMQKQRYEAPHEVPAAQRISIDTTRPLREQIEKVVARLGGRR